MAQVATDDPRKRGEKPPFSEPTQPHPGEESKMRNKPDHGEESYVGSARLQGKVALITGGDSGIGRAVALAFAREGADVAIAYFSEHHDAADTAGLVAAEGRRSALLAGDLADPQFCEDLVRRTVTDLGHVDILVNNAAYQGKAVQSINELDPERIEKTFRVNIQAMFHLSREAFKHMKPGSSIINTASIQAYKPSAEILDYATTKAAIVGFTKGLAQEAIKSGIRVNCVAPGPVWTPLIAQSFDKEKVQGFGESYPMQRPAQPAELAPAYVFLASNDASYINGEVIGVTGGAPLA